MEDRLGGALFMIRLCDLCDLCVKFLLRPKPSGLNGKPARRGVIQIPLCDLCDLCVKFLLRPKPSGLDGIEGVVVTVLVLVKDEWRELGCAPRMFSGGKFGG